MLPLRTTQPHSLFLSIGLLSVLAGPSAWSRQSITLIRARFRARSEGLGAGAKRNGIPIKDHEGGKWTGSPFEKLPFCWRNCLLPSARGGLIPNPPPYFLPHDVSDAGCCKSSLRGTVDWCLGGLIEGIIYNEAWNLKGDMDVRKGGGSGRVPL